MTTPTKGKQPSPEHKEGDQLECVSSKSCGYTLGQVYTVSKDITGRLGLKGNDGIFDPLDKLVSKFKTHDPKKQPLRIAT